MLTRRRVFVGGVASVICAPAIVRAESLMPIRALIVPMQPVPAVIVVRKGVSGGAELPSRSRRHGRKPCAGRAVESRSASDGTLAAD
jgi:hypothetical protein